MSDQTQHPGGPQVWGAPQPPPAKPKHAKGTGRVAIAIYAAVVGIIIGSASAGADTSNTATPEPEATTHVTIPGPTETVEVPGPTVTVTVKPPKPAGPASSFPGDGTYIVGKDIQAGTYRSKPAGGAMPMCYWSRLSSLSGELGSILANDIGKGQTTVTILAGDKAFETKGCQEWVRVD